MESGREKFVRHLHDVVRIGGAFKSMHEEDRRLVMIMKSVNVKKQLVPVAIESRHDCSFIDESEHPGHIPWHFLHQMSGDRLKVRVAREGRSFKRDRVQ
jgi:hypothetical protein